MRNEALKVISGGDGEGWGGQEPRVRDRMNVYTGRLVSEMTEYEGVKKKNLLNKVIPTSSLKNCEPLMISCKN